MCHGDTEKENIMLRCQKCNSSKIYSVEFRTDYAKPRSFYPENMDSSAIEDEEIPYRMKGYYCMDCDSFCSIYDDTQVDSL